MERIAYSYYARLAWNWLKSRSLLTLAVGAGIGALLDDWVIGLLRLLF